MNIIAALLIFGIIVTIHEFGHFIFAVRAGIKVVEFSLGMGPRLYTWHGKLTDYSLKLFPIGGSCMMLGEDEDEERAEGSFNSKSVPARLSVIFAGPAFNFILAFIMSLFVIGMVGTDSARLIDVSEGYPAVEAGMKAGDIITSVNGNPVVIYRDLSLYLYMHQGEPVEIGFKRPLDNGKFEKFKASISPKLDESSGRYMLGIVTSGQREAVKNPVKILGYSLYEVYYNISSTIKSLAYMFGGHLKAEELSGPVGIINMVGSTVEESRSMGIKILFLSVANMIVLLSANLGVMNLLPIPALDGGRIVFLIAEGIMGKALNRKAEGIIHLVGFAFLMGLMIIVLFNDIRNIFFR